tara:strand:- start:3429 stop:5285 length:1857 start_codon:yes stop_codon:yes gene_type:complete
MPVFDIETDGFLDVLTKIHVVSYQTDTMSEPKSIFDYDEMREFFLSQDTLVGHFITGFDIPAVEKVLGIKITARVIDTLAVSWYLTPERGSHGLASYGEDFGVPKPVVTDWEGLSQEEYSHRCQEDVKINVRLWKQQDSKLDRLYLNDHAKFRFLDYLKTKMLTVKEQSDNGWGVDVAKANSLLNLWEAAKAVKVEQLTSVMPDRLHWVMKHKPALERMTLKNGLPSAAATTWFALLKEAKYPLTTESLRVVQKTTVANPNSPDQVKDWLFSMGWSPCTFNFIKEGTGNNVVERKIPQIRKDGELCNSVKRLIDVNKDVGVLDGLTVLSHRIGIVKAFISCERDGKLKATISGLTNTFRFKHSRPLVNLPSVDKPYGEDIRSCLIATGGMTLCGADMVSLEDTTKRHYMQPLDPDYVEEMSREGFDPHLDLAKFAGAVTQEDIDKHNSGEVSLKALRKNYKVVNYSATYGVGASKLARETGLTQAAASNLLQAFWQRNWAVQEVANKARVRELLGKSWIQNPVSKFWHVLRSEKDRFSTLNQSTGVYCFDVWVQRVRAHGARLVGQFHDEVIVELPKGGEELMAGVLKDCMVKTNGEVKLNIPLGIDYSFGKNYAEIH